MTKDCKNLIRKLLIKDETKRLGSRAGASDVKEHVSFKTLNWALLRNTKPPIIPRERVINGDSRNYSESFSLELEGPKTSKPNNSDKSTNLFEKFNSSKWLNAQLSCRCSYPIA